MIPRQPRCLAVVPAFNEAGAIAATVADIRAHAPGFDVVVVDDGSRDGTAAIARSAGARVIELPFNVGIGGAVQTGFKYADAGGYDVAVQVDGDGQHDARHLPGLLAQLQERPELNMVVGSRFLSEAGFRSTRARRLGIRVFARVLSVIVGQPVTDPTSGLRMVDRQGIELFARDYPHDYPEVEAVLLLHFHRLRSAEVPVTMRARTTGASSINAHRSAYYMAKVLLAIAVGILRARPAAAPAPLELEPQLASA
jgi:glycosyltransferase involved in cell wall biosynthesis